MNCGHFIFLLRIWAECGCSDFMRNNGTIKKQLLGGLLAPQYNVSNNHSGFAFWRQEESKSRNYLPFATESPWLLKPFWFFVLHELMQKNLVIKTAEGEDSDTNRTAQRSVAGSHWRRVNRKENPQRFCCIFTVAFFVRSVCLSEVNWCVDSIKSQSRIDHRSETPGLFNNAPPRVPMWKQGPFILPARWSLWLLLSPDLVRCGTSGSYLHRQTA